MEVIETATNEDWDQVGGALVADARDCLDAPSVVCSTAATPALRPPVARTGAAAGRRPSNAAASTGRPARTREGAGIPPAD